MQSYLPSFNYNPYPANSYQQQYAQTVQPYNQQTPQPSHGIIWVDGEVGAKAYQFPQNWPVNTPLALWDTNDQVIYLKSYNQMGMPNPVQKLRHTMQDGEKRQAISETHVPEGEFVRREDLDRVKEELMEAINTANEQKGAKNNGKPTV